MNKLLNKLRAWYAGLQQREQRMVTIGGVAVRRIERRRAQ